MIKADPHHIDQDKHKKRGGGGGTKNMEHTQNHRFTILFSSSEYAYQGTNALDSVAEESKHCHWLLLRESSINQEKQRNKN